jgi:prevent-host-death family protein
MTIQVNIARAKATLSELVALAEAGEEVVLARAGKPVAVIRAASSGRPHFRIGALAHLGPLTDQEATAFLQPDPELERLARAEDEDHLYR